MQELLLIKVLVVLALILLGAYLTAVLVKKYQSRFGLTENKIHVIEHKKIDHKSSLILVQIEQKKFVMVLGINSVAIHQLE